MRDKIDKMMEDAREVVTGSNTDNDLRARLHADHEDVANLIDRMISTNDDSMRGELCARIILMLNTHARAEEEVVYTFVHQQAIDRGDTQHAMREHMDIDRCLDQLKMASVSDPSFVDLARQLKDVVTHHVHEEETQFLPKAEQEIGRERLAALIPQFNQRKSELMAAAARQVERGRTRQQESPMSRGFEEAPSQY